MTYPKTLTIIATWQRPESLERALASLLGEPTDVIVVGMGISDRVKKDFTRAFKLLDKELIIIEDEISHTKARNKGIEYGLEHGYNYLFFMDDDNVVTSGYIANLVNILNNYNDIFAASGLIQTYGLEKEKHYKQWREFRAGAFKETKAQRIYIHNKILYITEQFQVIPYREYEKFVEVDYFVNSWIQRAKAHFFDEELEILGEEILYTLKLPEKKVVIQDFVMFHFPETKGGLRGRKEDKQKRLEAWRKFSLKAFGEECIDVYEYEVH